MASPRLSFQYAAEARAGSRLAAGSHSYPMTCEKPHQHLSPPLRRRKKKKSASPYPDPDPDSNSDSRCCKLGTETEQPLRNATQRPDQARPVPQRGGPSPGHDNDENDAVKIKKFAFYDR